MARHRTSPSPGADLLLGFLGAAGTVTGSCLDLRTKGGRLVVDCGLFQGPQALQALNYARLPLDPGALDAVVLTHAHLDHAGLLPLLTARGFRRRAFATLATCDLLRWVLVDAGAIQEGDTRRLNKRNERRDLPALEPLFTVADAERSLERLVPVPLGERFEPMPGMGATLRNAGHILGSAWVEIEIHAQPGEAPLTLVVSGDVGPRSKTLAHDPERPSRADILVLEATYGDRTREPLDETGRRAALGAEVRAALAAGGNLLIPAFAVERSQELIHDLLLLARRREIPATPIFLDSPLAQRATDVFTRHRHELEIAGDVAEPFSGPPLHVTESVEQSKAIGRIRGGAIIIAGSGMCEAGRIKHHLKDNLWRSESTVLFTGYQAPGTLGQVIRSGVERVRIHGEEIAVKARIRALDAYSGHADRDGLVAWAQPVLDQVGAIFLVHGEAAGLEGLATALAARGVERERIHIPTIDDRFAISRRADGLRVEPIALSPGERRVGPELARILAAGRDWHNDYAATLLALRRALNDAPDDAARQVLLREIEQALSARRRAARGASRA